MATLMAQQMMRLSEMRTMTQRELTGWAQQISEVINPGT